MRVSKALVITVLPWTFAWIGLTLQPGMRDAQYATSPAKDAYKDTLEAWRKQQETELLAPRGWLSVAGLFWLKEGENTIGSDAKSDIVLPKGAPRTVGMLVRNGKEVTFRVTKGNGTKVNGVEVGAATLKPDTVEGTDRVTVGDMEFNVIERGDRMGVRLYDPNCKGRKGFRGRTWYDISLDLKVRAKFVAYDPPRPMRILNVIGDTRETVSPGYAEFKIGGVKYRLDAEDAGEGLFFNFKDKTSGTETYPAGRFLDADKPKDGIVVLDFNRATNPPCAFTAFATCPLPPPGNTLSLAVTAGEKNYHMDRS